MKLDNLSLDQHHSSEENELGDEVISIEDGEDWSMYGGDAYQTYWVCLDILAHKTIVCRVVVDGAWVFANGQWQKETALGQKTLIWSPDDTERVTIPAGSRRRCRIAGSCVGIWTVLAVRLDDPGRKCGLPRGSFTYKFTLLLEAEGYRSRSVTRFIRWANNGASPDKRPDVRFVSDPSLPLS